MKKVKSMILILSVSFILVSCSNNKVSKKDDVYYAIGDSITWLDNQKFNDSNEKAIGYPTQVANILGYNKVLNKGISGASLAKNDKYPDNKSILLDNDYSDLEYADLITIFVGTNDFKLNVPVGNLTDSSNGTFTGAYNILLDKIEKESDAKIVLITPLRRNNDDYTSESKNKSGNYLNDYVESVKGIGKERNLDVIDLFNGSEINDSNLDKYTKDGLHPNNEGFMILSEEISERIK